MPTGDPKPPDEAASRRRWLASALAVFLAAHVWFFHGVLGSRFDEHVTSSTLEHAPGLAHAPEDLPREGSLPHTDQRFVVWLTARNSAAPIQRPERFFDAGVCHPAPAALTFGEPGLTLGWVGWPVWWLTGDPVVTFNCVFLFLVLAAALAMYWLVVEWTGVPAAGIVAGFAFAYSDLRVGDVVHVNVYDNAWTVFAMLFATRMFTRRRWRDAFGLAGSIALQMGASLDPLVGAVLVSLPVALGLVFHFGLRRLRAAHVAAVAAVVAAVALFLFPPYLEARGVEGLRGQTLQVFLPLGFVVPGAVGFFGWSVWGLLLAGFFVGRARALRAGVGDPRWALLAGLALVALTTLVGVEGDRPLLVRSAEDGPVLYRLATGLLPGLDVVRAPAVIYLAGQLVACIGMGIGMAGLYRALPLRRSHWFFGVVLAFVALEVGAPQWLGMEPRVRYGTIAMRPHDDDIALLGALGEADADRAGALLEVPMVPSDLDSSSLRVLHSAWHGRRTSACYNSSRYRPEVLRLARRLPAPDALAAAWELGFDHVVLHHRRENPIVDAMLERFEAHAASGRRPAVERVGSTERMTVYRIRP